MDEHRSAVAFCDLECIVKRLHVMPVHRSEIDKAHILKDRGLDDIVAHSVFGVFQLDRKHITNGRCLADDALDLPLCADIVGAAADARQIFCNRTDILGDRLVVVVQNDNQIGLGLSCVVESLIDHAAGHGAVSDDSDGVMRSIA